MTDYFNIDIMEGDNVLIKAFDYGFETVEVIKLTKMNVKIKKYNKTRTTKYINPKDCINLKTLQESHPEFFL